MVRVYRDERQLNVFQGMRKVLPADAYPSLEIEPNTSSNRWATTRAQRPRFEFNCTMTARCDNEKFAVEYICTLATTVVEIMCSPENLQLPVIGEARWDPNGGLVDTIIMDSLVESVTYNAVKEGTIRTAEFSWFAEIHEPFPESKWKVNDATMPTVIRPGIVEA